MITVGVKELRRKFGFYLREIKQGRQIEITRRGERIAMLVPFKQVAAAQIAEMLSREGIGFWKGGKPQGSRRRVSVRGKTVSQVVIGERG